jgi:hypothetical protein
LAILESTFFLIFSHTAGTLIVSSKREREGERKGEGVVRNEDGGFEFLDVAFGVPDRVVDESSWTAIADRSAPVNRTEFIHEFKDVSEREKTQESVTGIQFQFTTIILRKGIIHAGNYPGLVLFGQGGFVGYQRQ